VSAGPLASLRLTVHPDDTLQVLPGGIVGRWTGRMAAPILTQPRGVPEVDRLSYCAFVFVDEAAEDVMAVELPRCG
jgi:hypothetical protein